MTLKFASEDSYIVNGYNGRAVLTADLKPVDGIQEILNKFYQAMVPGGRLEAIFGVLGADESNNGVEPLLINRDDPYGKQTYSSDPQFAIRGWWTGSFEEGPDVWTITSTTRTMIDTGFSSEGRSDWPGRDFGSDREIAAGYMDIYSCLKDLIRKVIYGDGSPGTKGNGGLEALKNTKEQNLRDELAWFRKNLVSDFDLNDGDLESLYKDSINLSGLVTDFFQNTITPIRDFYEYGYQSDKTDYQSMFSDEYLRGRQNYENFAQNLTFNFYEFDPEKFTANSSYDYIAAMGDLALVKLGTLSEDRDGNFVSRARAYASNMYYNEAVSETDVIEDRISEHVFIGLNNKIVSAGRYDAEKLAGLKRELDQRRAKLARESIMVKVPGQEGYINLSAEEAQSLSQLYGAQYTTIENTGDGLLEIRLNDGIREYERFKKTDGSMMYERFYNLDGSFRQVSRQISEKAKEENTGFGIRLNQVREQVETTAYFSRQGGLLDSIT